MNKSKVCVKLTRKNPKKVFGILEMFGEKVFHSTRLILKDGDYLIEGYPFVYWNGHYWLGCEYDTGKTLVKPRELRNILAKEHLKKGDVVVLDGGGKAQFIARIDGTDDHRRWPFNSSLWMELNEGDRAVQSTEGSFDNFLRFATDEEKALLETKQTIETVDPVNSFTGYVPGQATCTHEVWVNHYSDREFYVHYDEQSAYMSIGRRGEGTTVKATLTYDIPMTKV